MNRAIRNLLILVILVLAGFAVYSNSFQNAYHYDDAHHIVGNQYLTSIRNIPLFFTDSRTFSSLPEARNHYRPLLLTSYALNYYFSKFRPAGYHIVNLSFHVGSAFLIFLIVQAMVGSREGVVAGFSLRPKQIAGGRCHSEACESKPKNLTLWFIRFFASLRMTGRGKKLEARSQKQDGGGFFAALAAGLIFLTTPFNSEVVNYISARSSVMCTFFYLLSFYFWVRFRSVAAGFSLRDQGNILRNLKVATAPYYLASLFAFLLAMLTKEVAITLPALLFVYDVCFVHPHPVPPPLRGREKGGGILHSILPPLPLWEGIKGRGVIPYIPFVIVAGIAGFLLRKIVCGNVLLGGLTSPRGTGTQFFTQLRLVLKYIYMTVVPIELSVEHIIRLSSSLWEPGVLVSLIILTSICVTLFLLWGSKNSMYRSISFWGVWFFITMSPTAVIPLNDMFQENRGYLPGVGVIVVGGILLSQGIRFLRFQERVQTYLQISLLAILVLAYGGMTWGRNKVWKDDATLWKDVEEKYPMSRDARREIARTGMAEKPELGEEYLKEILRNDPRDTLTMNNLGILYANKGRNDLSEETFLKAIEINPTDYKLHFNLAKVYEEKGDKESAAREYREVLRLAPDHTVTAELLAALYVKMGKEDMVEGAFQEASQKDPGNPAFHRGLGITYARQQKWDMAAEAFKKVLEITPDDVQTRIDLGDSYMKMDRLDLAEEEFRHALELEPDNRMANQGLGILYQKQGQHELALKHYEKAIEGRSPSPKVLNNMATIYLSTGKTGRAIEVLREALRLDPSYHIARINIGRAYEAQGRVEEAGKEYRKVLEAGDREKIPAEVYQEAKRRLVGLH